MTTNAVADELLGYLRKVSPLVEEGEVGAGKPLREIINSVDMLEFLAFVEDRFEITIQDEDVVPENFRNVASCAGFVCRKRSW